MKLFKKEILRSLTNSIQYAYWRIPSNKVNNRSIVDGLLSTSKRIHKNNLRYPLLVLAVNNNIPLTDLLYEFYNPMEVVKMFFSTGRPLPSEVYSVANNYNKFEFLDAHLSHNKKPASELIMACLEQDSWSTLQKLKYYGKKITVDY